MIETIYTLLESLFDGTSLGRHMVVLLLSMLPAISGPSIAIPIGAALGLPPITNAMASIVGNILPVPLIVLFVRRVFAFMRRISPFLGKVADKFEAKANSKRSLIVKSTFVGLIIFVAIPLPIPAMGAWTGALIAALLNVRLRVALPAIAIGIIISAAIVTALTYGLIAVAS